MVCVNCTRPDTNIFNGEYVVVEVWGHFNEKKPILAQCKAKNGLMFTGRISHFDCVYGKRPRRINDRT